MVKQGLIVKLLGGFYYVLIDGETYECKQTGKVKKLNQGILVGDRVEVDLAQDTNVITKIFERRNSFIRPAIANVDQVIIVMSAREPNFSSYLVNTFLALIESQEIKPIILITKIDLIDDPMNDEEIKSFVDDGYEVYFVSNSKGIGHDKLKGLFKDKISILTGQTGVGKSSTFNNLDKNLNIKTQEISMALGRGKHTTRHVELFNILGGWVADSPGFGSLDLQDMPEIDLAHSFKLFKQYSQDCKFRNCVHHKEVHCGVKKAVEENKISKIKYNDYIKLLEKIKSGGKGWK